MLRILLWVAGAALAVFVGLSSTVIASQVRQPAKAYALGVAPSGIAAGNLAFALYAARKQQDPNAAVTARERALAAKAYRAEPLSSAGLGILIVSKSGSSESETRHALLDLAGELTRRSSLITSASIEAAARRGEEAAFFRWLSRAILTNRSQRTAYLRAMALATARSNAVDTLAPVIGPRPSWADEYWRLVAAVPQSLENAAELRVRVARAPWRQTEIANADRLLALMLVRRGHFDGARRLYEGLGPAREGESSNALANGTFARKPQLPPFDWQLAASGTLGSSIDGGRKGLRVSAIGGARGFAARQLVRLSPGAYNLSWSMSAVEPVDPGALSARIYCAEPGVKAANPLPVPLKTGEHMVSLTIGDSACRWHWISIDAALPDNSAGIDAYFRSIALTPASGSGARDPSASVSDPAADIDFN